MHAFVTRDFEVVATLVSRDGRIEENLWALAFFTGDTVFWPISHCAGLSNGWMDFRPSVRFAARVQWFVHGMKLDSDYS